MWGSLPSLGRIPKERSIGASLPFLGPHAYLEEGGATGQRDSQRNSVISGEESGWQPPGSQIDRGWAWVVLTSSAVLQGLSMGLVSSNGVFIAEWIDIYQDKRTAISWIGSLSASCAFFAAPIASALSNRFSHRFVIIVGSLLCTFGTLVTSFAGDLHLLYISFGVITGLGISFQFGPAMMFIGTYFTRYQSLALALSSVGGGCGGMAFAPLFRYLINQYGWRGAMMVTSGILLNGSVLGALLCPAESWIQKRHRKGIRRIKTTVHFVRNETYCNDPSAKAARYKIKSEDEFRNGINIADGKEYVETPSASASDNTEPANLNNKHRKTGFSDNLSINVGIATDRAPRTLQGSDVYETAKTPPTQSFGAMFDVSLLSDVNQWLLIIGMVLWTTGSFVFFVYVVDFAKQIGLSDYLAAAVLSVISAFSTLPRVLVAFLINWTSVKPLHIYILSALFAGLVSSFLPLASTTTFMIVCALFGCSMGTLNATIGITTVQLFGLERCTASFCYQMAGSGFGALFGPPIAEALYDASQNYAMSFYFAAVSMFLSGCAVGLISVKEWINKKS